MYPSISSYPRLSTLLPSVRTAHCSSDAAKAKDDPLASLQYFAASLQYFALCGMSGALASGLTHGFLALEYGQLANPAILSRFPTGSAVTNGIERQGLVSFRGVVTHGKQGLAKFGLYEGFKKLGVAVLGEEDAYNKRFLVYGTAAAMASPLGIVYSTTTNVYLDKINENTLRLDKITLQENWARKVSAKVMLQAAIQFTVYEWAVEMIQPSKETERTSFIRLASSTNAGMAAGLVCALITHPYGEWRSAERVELAKAFGEPRNLFRARTSGMAVACGLQWTIYEGFKIAMGLPSSSPFAMSENLRKKKDLER